MSYVEIVTVLCILNLMSFIYSGIYGKSFCSEIYRLFNRRYKDKNSSFSNWICKYGLVGRAEAFAVYENKLYKQPEILKLST